MKPFQLAYSRIVAEATKRLGYELNNPPCPVCSKSLTTFRDLAYSMPWFYCPCGYSGDMIRIFAQERNAELRDLFSIEKEEVAKREFQIWTQERELKFWWDTRAVTPIESKLQESWPGSREACLIQFGLNGSQSVLDCLQGLLVVTTLDDLPSFMYSSKYSNKTRIVCFLMESAPGRAVGLKIGRFPTEDSYRTLKWVDRYARVTSKNQQIHASFKKYMIGLYNQTTPAEVILQGDLYDYLQKRIHKRLIGLPDTYAFGSQPLMEEKLSESFPLKGKTCLWKSSPRSGVDVHVPSKTGVRWVRVHKDGVFSPVGRLISRTYFRILDRVSTPDETVYTLVGRSDGYPAEWIKETQLKGWIKKQVGPNKHPAGHQLLFTVVYALGLPPVREVRTVLGWCPEEKGFITHVGVIKNGVKAKRPWIEKAVHDRPNENRQRTMRLLLESLRESEQASLELKTLKADREILRFLKWLTASPYRLSRVQQDGQVEDTLRIWNELNHSKSESPSSVPSS